MVGRRNASTRIPASHRSVKWAPTQIKATSTTTTTVARIKRLRLCMEKTPRLAGIDRLTLRESQHGFSDFLHGISVKDFALKLISAQFWHWAISVSFIG